MRILSACFSVIVCLAGCSSYKIADEPGFIEIKAQSKDIVEKTFESKPALNQFFDAVNRRLIQDGRLKPGNTKPVYFSDMQYHMQGYTFTLSSQNTILNSYLKDCDSNKDGVITFDEVAAFGK